MTHHSDLDRLRHMRDHAREAAELVRGRTRAHLDADRVLVLALTRLMEIVGEAANRISISVQNEHPQIPWPQIISLRHRLIHGYDAVDLEILWQIIAHDVPRLLQQLDEIIAPRDRDSSHRNER